MKHDKGLGPMSKEEYCSKLHQLKVSHFMQCHDLTSAFNGQTPFDKSGILTRDLVSAFLKKTPQGSFEQFCMTLGEALVDTDVISRQEFNDTIDNAKNHLLNTHSTFSPGKS